MKVLKDMRWAATLFAAGPMLLLFIDGAVFWEVALIVLLAIVGLNQYKMRLIASYDGVRLWLRDHGHIYEVENIQRNKSKILAASSDGNIYEQDCSYCITTQIDQFVSKCHLTRRCI